MTTYRITVSGCDDETAFDLDLTDDEAAAVRKVAQVSADTSEYGCMPTLAIHSAIKNGPRHD